MGGQQRQQVLIAAAAAARCSSLICSDSGDSGFSVRWGSQVTSTRAPQAASIAGSLLLGLASEYSHQNESRLSTKFEVEKMKPEGLRNSVQLAVIVKRAQQESAMQADSVSSN